jgi:shikimate kinase
MKNIYLCGFMGCGKSTVGPALARLLNREFIDFDAYIEKQAGKKVRDIFRENGEQYFRSLEHAAANKISGMNGIVAATGGGTVLSAENVKVLKSSGVIVLIDVPLDVIAKRLEGDSSRPLLQKPDKEEAMRLLFEKRIAVYRSVCDYSVSNADNRSAYSVASEIARIPELNA